MLHVKYQGSMPCGFRKKVFSCFDYISLCKHVTHGVEPFWRQGHNLNKHGRGLPNDATNQISRLYALWFRQEYIFHVFPI